MSSELLDPVRVADAGARHGQMASSIAGGGLSVSCQKLIEDAARSTVVLIPDLLRVDVRHLDDTLQVVTRSLNPVPARWEITDEAAVTDYGKKVGESRVPYRLEFVFEVVLEPRPIRGRVLLSSTVDWHRGLLHLVAHAVAGETSA